MQNVVFNKDFIGQFNILHKKKERIGVNNIKKNKKIAANTLYTIGGMLVMNGVLQILIYPLLNKQMGADTLGGLLFIMGFVGILGPSVGQALNTSRLVVGRDYEVSNGDYVWMLLTFGGIGSLIILWISRDSIVNVGMGIGVFLLLMITILRYYGDVEYRLNLNYKRYFIYYVILAVGYIAGFALYQVSDYWLLIFLMGECGAIFYVTLSGTIFRNPFRRSEAFQVACKRGFFLILSYLVTNTTLNMDRLILKNMMGNVEVTQYYVVSLVGKTMVLLVAPINTIIISYLTKRKERLTKGEFLKSAMVGGIVSFVFFLCCQVGTPLFVWLFYRDLFETVKGLMTIVNITQILGMYSAFLFILVLTFTDEKWQLWLQAAHIVILTTVSVIFTKMYGIIGFSWAFLGANALRVAAVIILGSVKADKKIQ